MPLVHETTPTAPDPVFAHPVSSLVAPALAPPIVTSAPTAGQGVALDSSGRLPVGATAQSIPVLTADPASPIIGQMWYRSDTSQFCIRHNATTTKRVALA